MATAPRTNSDECSNEKGTLASSSWRTLVRIRVNTHKGNFFNPWCVNQTTFTFCLFSSIGLVRQLYC